jgi:hypothetical protein
LEEEKNHNEPERKQYQSQTGLIKK